LLIFLHKEHKDIKNSHLMVINFRQSTRIEKKKNVWK